MKDIDVILLSANASLLISNCILWLIYLYAAIRFPRINAFRIWLIALPFYLFLEALNTLAVFGDSFFKSIFPRPLDQLALVSSALITPAATILNLVGACCLVGYISANCPQSAENAKDQKSANRTLTSVVIAVGYPAAILSVIFFPLLFGGIGFACGIIALVSDRFLNGLAITLLSLHLMVLGVILGTFNFPLHLQ